MKYNDNLLFIVFILSFALVMSLIIMTRTSADYVPIRIVNFCKVTHEVYGSSYEECTNSYKQHAKEQK
jgi:hypothetical protein